MNRPPQRDSDALPLWEWKQIDWACDRFEAAWRAESPAELAAIVGEVAEPVRRRLFGELLAIDLEFRSRLGDIREPAAYRAEFPDYAPEIDAAFSARRQGDGAGPGRDRTIV